MRLEYNERYVIEEILRYEQFFGGSSFIEGLSDDSQVEGKLRFVMELFVGVSNKEQEKQEILTEMICSNALSPSAGAYILASFFPDNSYLKSSLTAEYKRIGQKYYDIFQNIYIIVLEEASYTLQNIQIINSSYCVRYKNTPSKWFTGRCAVYTVITGSYDTLADPDFVTPGWDYYCFTDNPDGITSKVWKAVDINECCRDITKGPINRYVKTHPHVLLKDYDYTIYVDGAVKILSDLRAYIGMFSRDSSMLAFPHPSRETIREEAGAIISWKKADPALILAQLDKYYEEGYKDDRPLIYAGCMVRSNRDPLLNKVMEDWWVEIRDVAPRDQMSIGYVCWKNNYTFDLSNLHQAYNPFIKVRSHSENPNKNEVTNDNNIVSGKSNRIERLKKRIEEYRNNNPYDEIDKVSFERMNEAHMTDFSFIAFDQTSVKTLYGKFGMEERTCGFFLNPWCDDPESEIETFVDYILTEMRDDFYHVFIVYARAFDCWPELAMLIKMCYPNCILALYYGDLIKKHRFTPDIAEQAGFDYVFSFDLKDAQDNGVWYLQEPLSNLPGDSQGIKETNDIMFVGEAKDRLSSLISAFEYFEKNGLKNDFYIFRVEDKDMRYRDRITYNKWLEYEDIINIDRASRCLLEIMQGGGSYSPTTRYSEAKLLKKKIITNCPALKDSKDPNVIYFSDLSEVDIERIKEQYIDAGDDIDWEDFFSVSRMISTMADSIIENTKEEG